MVLKFSLAKLLYYIEGSTVWMFRLFTRTIENFLSKTPL